MRCLYLRYVPCPACLLWTGGADTDAGFLRVQLRSESAARQAELEATRQQLSAERATAQRLEQLLSSARGQQCQADTAQQQLSGELAQTADRLAALQSKL